MSTQFRCTACGERFALDDSTTGPIRCPHCQAPVTVPSSVAQATHPAASPPARQRLATAALVCGIIGLVGCFPLGLVGMVLGIVALVKAIARPQECRGRGRAIAGVCTGAAGLLVFMVLQPSLSRVRELSNRLACGANLRAIASSNKVYAEESQARLPGDLQILADTGELPLRSLRCPSCRARPSGAHTCYSYVLLDVSDLDFRCVLAYEKQDHHLGEGGNVLFADGHVEFVTPYSRVEQMVTETKQRIAEARKKQTPEAP